MFTLVDMFLALRVRMCAQYTMLPSHYFRHAFCCFVCPWKCFAAVSKDILAACVPAPFFGIFEQDGAVGVDLGAMQTRYRARQKGSGLD